MKILPFVFVFLIALVDCRPKNGAFDSGLELNELSVNPNTRLYQNQRHSLASDSRRSEGLDFCRKSAKCQTLNFTSCLGKELPYSQTTLELVGDSRTQEDVHVFKISVFTYRR